MVKFGVPKLNANQLKKLEKAGVSPRTIDSVIAKMGGPAWDCLALEYFFCTNVLLFAAIMQVHGAPKSYKSTLVFYILRRYFSMMNAGNAVIDAELKINPAQLSKVYNIPMISSETESDAEPDNGSELTIYRTGTLETVQTVIQTLVRATCENTVKEAKKPKDQRVPTYQGISVDSVRVASKITQDSVKADGHASKNFAVEAALWRTFLATMNDLMCEMPVSLWLINHTIEKTAATGFGTTKTTGGGMAIKYLQSFQFYMSNTGEKETKGRKEVYLKMKVDMSSYGPSKRTISPRVIHTTTQNEAGEVEETIDFDFDYADAMLLTGDKIPRKALADAGVCNTKASSTAGLYSDSVLGLTNVPITEITKAIYADPDKLAKFRAINNINVYKTLDDLWDTGWFYDGAATKLNAMAAAEGDD